MRIVDTLRSDNNYNLGDIVKKCKDVIYGILIGILFIGFLGIIIFLNEYENSNLNAFAEENNPILISILSLFMAADFLIGLTNAIVFKNSKKTRDGKLQSRAGTKGIAKKTSVLLLVILTFILTSGGKSFNMIYEFTAIAFILMEFLSILENFSLMGIPVDKVERKIRKFLDEEDKKIKKRELKEKKEEDRKSDKKKNTDKK